MLIDKESLKNAAKVMLAYADGELIQYREANSEGPWTVAVTPCWDWMCYEYRIKPEPEYRPYNSVDEFMKDKEAHGDYLVIKERLVYPIHIHKLGITVLCGNGEHNYTYANLLKEFTWLDGSKCGKLVNG